MGGSRFYVWVGFYFFHMLKNVETLELNNPDPRQNKEKVLGQPLPVLCELCWRLFPDYARVRHAQQDRGVGLLQDIPAGDGRLQSPCSLPSSWQRCGIHAWTIRFVLPSRKYWPKILIAPQAVAKWCCWAQHAVFNKYGQLNDVLCELICKLLVFCYWARCLCNELHAPF